MSNLIRVLNVAEKPSVASSISKILSSVSNTSPTRISNNESQYNPIFQFEYHNQNNLVGQHYLMLFTSVTGHLLESEFSSEYRSWSLNNCIDLFTAPIIKSVNKEKLPLKQQLQRLAQGVQLIILWLDCDREGENIAFEVLDLVKQVNNRIQVKRVMKIYITTQY